MYIDGEYYHPTFLYESLWNFAGLLFYYCDEKRLAEVKFSSLCNLVFSGTFFVEGLRTDSLYLWSTDIRIAQLVSIVTIIVAIVLIIYRRKKVKTCRFIKKRSWKSLKIRPR